MTRLALSALVLLWFPVLVAAEETCGAELCAAVAASPVSLEGALVLAATDQRVPLRAGFQLDIEDRLQLVVLLKSKPGEVGAFEEWSGPVHPECWVPRRRVVTEELELLDAQRLLRLVERSGRPLAKVVEAFLSARDAAGRKAQRVLSVTSALAVGEPVFVATVAIGDGIYQVVQDLQEPTLRSARRHGEPPKRVPIPDVIELPELVVPDGTWFQAKTPPTLAGWLGSPVLVVVSDPG